MENLSLSSINTLIIRNKFLSGFSSKEVVFIDISSKPKHTIVEPKRVILLPGGRRNVPETRFVQLPDACTQNVDAEFVFKLYKLRERRTTFCLLQEKLLVMMITVDRSHLVLLW